MIQILVYNKVIKTFNYNMNIDSINNNIIFNI